MPIAKYVLETRLGNWTSGDVEIDREIREAQIELSFDDRMD